MRDNDNYFTKHYCQILRKIKIKQRDENMDNNSAEFRNLVVVRRKNIQKLLDVLKSEGYRNIGPSLQDGAIVLDDISTADELPVGWKDEQESATYRLQKLHDDALFGYVVGPQSWKKYLFPPKQLVTKATRTRTGWKTVAQETDEQKLAFIGVRPCEIHALAALDKVFLEGEYADPYYAARRKNTLIIALNCRVVGGTCFCTSMGTGPKATFGFDLALTEVLTNGWNYFVVEIGSDRGEMIMSEVPNYKAREDDIKRVDEISAKAVENMRRKVDTSELKDTLQTQLEHSYWKDIASRCLTCGNCTLVCPTCFCSTVEDYTDLQGNEALRQRRWDSCFTMLYSYIHGGSVRYSSNARYRQWLTHKFASWVDQYGMFGCVGCGRCITWCPAGIDITEEIRTFQVNQILDQVSA